MSQAEPQLYCPNPVCQAPNPEGAQACQRCGSHLPKDYLWAVGVSLATDPPGAVLGDNRYVLKQNRIYLDTQPGEVPITPETIPDEAVPYLKLFPYRLHVPQIHDVVWRETEQESEAILLLEQAPLDLAALTAVPTSNPTEQAGPSQNGLLPQLSDVWPQATAFRQLSWLWQMASLWSPFAQLGVTNSLLSPPLLRAAGSLVRLLELSPAPSPQAATTASGVPGLEQLGQFWLQWWLPQAQPAIAEYLEHLCQNLVQGQFQSAEQLIVSLDQALAVCGRSQDRRVQIATQTDQGPHRKRNEDACHPPSGAAVTQPPGPETFSIICDGLGGHEGGSVASKLAIEVITQHLRALSWETLQNQPTAVMAELKQAIASANDKISQHNDAEQRRDRQRMGTTLVMAIAQAHTIYVAHVGDSRAYWITPTGCYPLTVDDDVASRDMRTGSIFYRDATLGYAAGSLTQALGMAPSLTLDPTVQRLLTDEAGMLLLCSDGLSDNDRVEQHWQTMLLPALAGAIDLPTACQNLVDLANTLNGHDNVTVSLLHYQPEESHPAAALPASLAEPLPLPELTTTPASALREDDPAEQATVTTKPASRQHRLTQRALLPLLLGGLLLGFGLWAAYWAVSSTVKLEQDGPPPARPRLQSITQKSVRC